MTFAHHDWIARHAIRTPDKVAAVDLHSARSFTYAAWHDRIGRLAGSLRDGLGIAPGERVAVLAENSTDYLEIQFACARAKAVFLPLNWRLALPELEFIVGDAGPVVLFCDAVFAEVGEELARRCGSLRHVIDMAPDAAPSSGYERGLAGAGSISDVEGVSLSDLSTVMYTSGTTGRPKGAMITHAMTFFNSINLGIPHRLSATSVTLTLLPLFHTGGLNCYSNPVLHRGGTVLIQRQFDPLATLRRITDPALGVTHFLGVPAQFQFMAQLPEFEEADFSTVQLAGIGASPTPDPLNRRWLSRGLPLVQGYGMTETGPVLVVLDPEDAADRVGSAGRPVQHTDIEIRRVDGSPAEIGEVGEICARGPNVTPGYWNRPEATAEAIVDGWMHTGDAAYVDADGFIYVVDRWKDMYISGGENVYPAEVENVLYELDGVVELAVVGVPDERWGEVGCAVVVAKPGASLDERAVIEHCQGRLARYKQPRLVVFLDALPRNASGKVLKHVLRKELAARADA